MLKIVSKPLAMLSLATFASCQALAFDVIAHRGAPGYLPEHTLASTAMAYAQQPDYIEQDLVLSKDGHLVILHDIHLETVTNVEQVFPDRQRDDGRFYALDFTLAELKSLRVHERTDANGKQVFANRYHGNGHFTIATFEEQISTIQSLNDTTGQQVGFYTEIKSPAWHLAQGVDISKKVLKVLRRYELDNPAANIYVQCFDYNEIIRLRDSLGAKVKLIQLLGENSWGDNPSDYDSLKTPEKMRALTNYVQGIGPWLGHINRSQDGQPTRELTPWIKAAQDAGLLIHPYTFRAEVLPEDMSAEQLLDLIIHQWQFDGLFTDQVPPVRQYLNNQ